jgi:hypothetical protein
MGQDKPDNTTQHKTGRKAENRTENIRPGKTKTLTNTNINTDNNNDDIDNNSNNDNDNENDNELTRQEKDICYLKDSTIKKAVVTARLTAYFHRIGLGLGLQP